MPKLTDKQKRFIDEFVLTNNATEAAINAGYSEKTARQIATENLSKPYIAEAVKKRRDQLQEMSDLDAQDVLKGFSELATISVVDLLTNNGEVDLVAIKEAGLGRFIQEFTITETPTKEGVKVQTKLKGYSRMDALKSLADIFGMKTEAKENPANTPHHEKVAKAFIALKEKENGRKLTKNEIAEINEQVAKTVNHVKEIGGVQ